MKSRLEERLSPTQESGQAQPPSGNAVEVLVRRTAGPRPTIYHRAAPRAAVSPVRGESRQLQHDVGLPRAQGKGLSPCTACWPSLADRTALQALEA